MGEKRAYKARKPGGGRKKLKPEYDAGKNLKDQMDAAVIRYKDGMTLQAIADALSLNPIKVRKLLITAGIYESDIAKMVQRTFNNYRETQSYKDAVLPPYPSKTRPVKFQSQNRREKAVRATNNLLHSGLVFAHSHKIHPKITPQSRKITD